MGDGGVLCGDIALGGYNPRRHTRGHLRIKVLFLKICAITSQIYKSYEPKDHNIRRIRFMFSQYHLPKRYKITDCFSTVVCAFLGQNVIWYW